MPSKKLTYLNKLGEIVNKSLKEIGTTWEKMHEIEPESPKKGDFQILQKYNIPTTIFNVANMEKYGHVQLPPHFVEIALVAGAVDRREAD